MSGDICCTDNRFEIIAAYKKKLIEGTNIEESPEEMAVIDNILFRFWQMGWLAPIPHGRLIDADALLFECNTGRIRSGESFVTRTYVNDAPTIIEAEGGET